MYRLAVLAALVAAAALALVWGHTPDPSGPVGFETAPVARADLETRIQATGTLMAVVTVRVGSQLSGQIAELRADYNDEVAAGEVLAVLDRSAFEALVREAEAELHIAEAEVENRDAALRDAEASLEMARVQRGVLEARLESGRAEAEKAAADLARARRLIERNIVAGEELDAARALAAVAEAGVRAAEAERAMQEPAIRAREARVEMAAADLATARAAVARVEAILARTKVDLSRTIIRAPIDGVVIDRNVDRGQTVAASLEAPTLFTIANDLRRMELHARVDEADVGQMRVGAPASFTVDAYPGERFSGQVSQIRKAPQRIQNVVTYTVLITAGNPELRLLPGMTAIADIVTETRENTLAVPNAALRFAPAGQVAAPPERTDGRLTGRLWRLSPDGEAEAVAVALGITDGSLTEILGGLEDGDRVAIGTRSGG